MEIQVAGRAFSGSQDCPSDTNPQVDLFVEKSLLVLFFVSLWIVIFLFTFPSAPQQLSIFDCQYSTFLDLAHNFFFTFLNIIKIGKTSQGFLLQKPWFLSPYNYVLKCLIIDLGFYKSISLDMWKWESLVWRS